MKENKIALRTSYWAMVSGGKDSLFMLRYLLEHPDKYQLDGVAHCELEIDYPFIRDVIDQMEKMCDTLNIPFVRIKPRKSWYTLYQVNGFPTRKCRWCNDHYKLDAVHQLREYLATRGYKLVQYIGFCANETRRINTERQKKSGNVYPLADAGIYESDILEWAREQPIFNNYYLFNDRCGCMFCPMASLTDHAYLAIHYPDHYRAMMELARQTETQLTIKFGKPISVWQGNPKYNTDYRDHIINKKYIPRILAKIEEVNK